MHKYLPRFYSVVVFFIVFSCLPLPHGNIYPFIVLILGCLHHQFALREFLKKKPWVLETDSYDKFALQLFLLWAGISACWSVKVSHSLNVEGKILVIAFAGGLWWFQAKKLKDIIDLEKPIFWATMLLTLFLTIFAIDIKYSGTLYKVIDQHISQALVHGCIACSLSIWLALQKFSKWLRAAILLSLIWILEVCSSDAAALGVILGGGALIFHKFLPRVLKTTFICGMPAVWAASPFVFAIFSQEQIFHWSGILDSSYGHRLFIWSSIVKQTFEKFWTGFGLGSSRHRYLLIDSGEVSLVKDGQKIALIAPENCLHPHNFMLQIWFELGVIGVALLCIAWIFYWKKNYEKTSPYCIAFWGSALSVAATSISLWQTWWLILMVTLLPIYCPKKADLA